MKSSSLRGSRLLRYIVITAILGIAFSAGALQPPDKTIPTQKQSANAHPAAPGSPKSGEKVPYAPRPEWIPVWAQPGNFHFARVDGGPIEPQKVKKSEWGDTFTERDNEVLGNLYSKHADQMVDLLSKAGVNWVWITWSVGFSWQHEAEQRKLAKEMVERLHRHGIHVAAYVCAITIMWQNMFLDQPRSVGWVDFAPDGVPYMYGGGADPLRFIANVNNPGWVQLEEKRVGAAIDAGFDAVFFDNTSNATFNNDQAMAGFFQKMRRYVHQDKHSHILLLANFGLYPNRVVLDKYTDAVFDEFFHEPGAWGNDWNVSNIRRLKYLRGIIPAWKPLITDYSIFRQGNRSTTFLSPRSERLATAEAATFGGSYTWDGEGPLDDGLIHQTKAAMASWNAIGEYNHFLTAHKDLYHGATQVANYLVLTPDTNIGFSWSHERNPLYDTLAKRSVLFNLKMAGRVDEKELARYPAVIIPAGEPWPEALKLYQQKGGKVDVIGQPSSEVTNDLLRQPPRCASLRINSGPNVLGNITRVDGGNALAVDILNYGQKPTRDVRVEVNIGPECRSALTGTLELLSPDYGGMDRKETVSISKQPVSFVLSKLDTYVVAVLR